MKDLKDRKFRTKEHKWPARIVNDDRKHPTLVFDEDGYAPISVDWDWYYKHKPHPGGYYVVYADGYKSYSPAKAFEDGYTRI